MLARSDAWAISAQTRTQLGESILWHPTEQSLYWIDAYGPHIYRQKAIGGPIEKWEISLGKTIGCIAFTDSGLLVAADHGLHLLDLEDGSPRALGNPKGQRFDLLYNDGKADRQGRFWLGTLCADESRRDAVFYRMNPDGSGQAVAHGFSICNGPSFSPDGRLLYFSDSIGQRILAYPILPSAKVAAPFVFYSYKDGAGLPDGVAVDRKGNLWCAIYGDSKVICISPDGVRLATLDLPATYPTSLCLGGKDLSTLFVTTAWVSPELSQDAGAHAGAIFMLPIHEPGLPEPILQITRA